MSGDTFPHKYFMTSLWCGLNAIKEFSYSESLEEWQKKKILNYLNEREKE